MALSRAEVRERHSILAAHACVHVMNLTGEPVRRKPLGERVGIEERPVDTFGRRAQHAVKAYGVGGTGHSEGLLWYWLSVVNVWQQGRALPTQG